MLKLFALFPILLSLSLGRLASAQTEPTVEPYPGLKIYELRKADPVNRIFAAVIDLRNPKLHVRVSRGGADPDGAGQWQTTLMTPTAVAAREKLDFVVNGDFFRIPKGRDAEGMFSPYKVKMFASVIGPAASRGRAWSTSRVARPCLVISKTGKASIEMLTKPRSKDWEVLSGNVELVKDGQMVPHDSQARHPRTVVGLTKKGTKLVVMVVDGRRPGVSEGMTYDELAATMIELGCWQAFNLDGGGSSMMAYRNKVDSPYRILNDPTDGHERPVANVLGVHYGSNLKPIPPIEITRTRRAKPVRKRSLGR